MRFPYRVEIYFEEVTDKFYTIQKVAAFLSQQVQGDWQKVNINRRVKNAYYSEFVGIEVMLAQKQDAFLFKLGFELNGERLQTKVYTEYGKSEDL